MTIFLHQRSTTARDEDSCKHLRPAHQNMIRIKNSILAPYLPMSALFFPCRRAWRKLRNLVIIFLHRQSTPARYENGIGHLFFAHLYVHRVKNSTLTSCAPQNAFFSSCPRAGRKNKKKVNTFLHRQSNPARDENGVKHQRPAHPNLHCVNTSRWAPCALQSALFSTCPRAWRKLHNIVCVSLHQQSTPARDEIGNGHLRTTN